MARRMMTDFHVYFMSGVDRPAQKPATATLIKNDTGETTMKTDAEKLADLQKRHDAVASMSPEQFAFYKGLSGPAADAFVDAAHGDRQSTISKAEGDNPVVYTSPTSHKAYRKSQQGEADLAKALDETIAKVSTIEAISKSRTLLAKAQTEYGNLPGEDAVKVALLSKVDEISEPATKTAIEAMLKAHGENIAKGTEVIGHNGSGKPMDKSALEAPAKLDALATERSTKKGISKMQAYGEIAQEPEGQALLKQIDDARI